MKFSIIVPVYNVEKYVEKCLQSINNQTYDNYEVIIVNDGSLDNSEKIIKQYIKGKKKFKMYKKKNGGLSDARNYGVQYVKGDYILFIDSDDYIELDLLFNLNKMLEKNKYDVLRYEARDVDEAGNVIRIPRKVNISNNKTIIESLLSAEYIEPAWLYAYKKNFWIDNNFEFLKGMIHEDYGLTLIVLSKTKSIGYINYVGYNYVQRNNSIMSSINYDKIKKRVEDFKIQFLNHRKVIIPNNKDARLLLSYSAEALIYKLRELNYDDRLDMIQFIKQERVINQIYNSSLRKRLKKLYLKIHLKRYLTKLHNNFMGEFK